MSSNYMCRVCGAAFPEDELILMDDELICETCLEEETVVCSDCGTRIWNEQDAGSSELHLCQRCFDRGYTTCERCGVVVSYDDAFYLDDEDDYPYCESCYNQLKCRAIHDYGYRPEPIFYGTPPRYFGVELEIDGAGEINRNAEKILAIGNRDLDRIYCKHDGSLNDGFEIVSHPATLECHTKDFPWAQMMKQAIQLGYSSHKAETCGLHVHISREAFGESVLEQEASIARLLFFVEKNWNELLKFSRRTNRQLERWAARYGYKDTPKEMAIMMMYCSGMCRCSRMPKMPVTPVPVAPSPTMLAYRAPQAPPSRPPRKGLK